MITVKGTRTGQRPGGSAADLYRTQEERPAARMVALLGAGIAGAVAYFASGSTAVAAPPAPPPKPPADAPEEAPPSPGELPRAASAAAAGPEAEEATDRAEGPPPPATEMAEFVDAPPELALAARLARLGPPSRAAGEEAPQAGIVVADDPVGAARIRPLPRARPSATGNDDEEEQPSGHGEETSDEEGTGEDDDETARNRAPRAGDPVSLPAVMATQAVFIPLASLLAGSSDPDGEPLEVRSLSASAGVLLPVEGGWVYLAPPRATEDVVLTYVISDGHDGVPQRAVFAVTPEGAVAAGTAAPGMFAALPASVRQGAAGIEEDAAAAPAAHPMAERAGPQEEAPAPAEGAAESPPADSTAGSDTATPAPSVAAAATLDPAAAQAQPASAAPVAADPAVASLDAVAPMAVPAAAPMDRPMATDPAVPMAMAAAPEASDAPDAGTTSAAASPAPAVTGASSAEADSFAFAPEPDPPQGESVSRIVALEVGDRVDVAAAPEPDPESRFAAAYADGTDALPYQLHAEAEGISSAPALTDPTETAPDMPVAPATVPDLLLTA